MCRRGKSWACAAAAGSSSANVRQNASAKRIQPTPEEAARVERTGRGFGMKLHRGDRQRAVPEPFVRTVVEVDHRRFEVVGQGRSVDRVAVIVRRDQDLVVDEVLDRLIAAAMAVRQLEGLRPAGEREQLMSQTHAEQRHLADQTAQRLDRCGQVARIARTRRDHDRVGAGDRRSRRASRRTGAR